MVKKLTAEERGKIYEEIFLEASNLVTRQMYRYLPYADGKRIGRSMRKLRDLLELVV